jgi:Zn-dependent oligopeptidase
MQKIFKLLEILILTFIKRIKTNLKPVSDEEFNKLQKYASKQGNMTTLESYDIEYWKTKHTDQYFGYI